MSSAPQKRRKSLPVAHVWHLPRVQFKQQLIRAHTGEVVSQDAYLHQLQSEQAYRKRVELAIRLAEPKHRVITAMTSNQLHRVGLCSGHSMKVIRAPRRMVFPEHASKSRNETMAALTYYLTENPGCRHLIITGGQRVPCEKVIGTLRLIMDRTRRLNHRDWFARKLEVIMRTAEVTCDHDTFHCHLHIVVQPLEPMDEGDWAAAIAEIEAAFGTIVVDSGPVTQPRAIARYLFKGTTQDDTDPLVLGTLMELLKNVRTHEPQGSFRDLCRELRRTNTKFIMIGQRLIRVDRTDGSPMRFQRSARSQSRAGDRNNDSELTHEQPQNMLLHVGHPIAGTTRVKEPHLLILNYNGDFSGFLAANPQFAKLRAELLPKFQAGLASVGNPPIVQLHQTTDRHEPGDSLIEEHNLETLGFDPADYFRSLRQIIRPAWIDADDSFST